MKPAHRALWIIESRLSEPLTLEEIARLSGVSPFHLARAFSAEYGMPLIQYARRRRLAEAAGRVRQSGSRILDIALEAGYSSHEAFTRAFRAEFRLSPEAWRNHDCAHTVVPLKAFVMIDTSKQRIPEPGIVELPALRLIGHSEHYDQASIGGIPGQWARFNAGNFERFSVQKDGTAFGVCYNDDGCGRLDYLCGVEVKDFSDVPESVDRLIVPAQTYAVFHHPGHISGIRQVWSAIWNDWLPDADYEAVEAPSFEKYGPAFDPQSGKGGFEIWVPVRSARR